MEEAPRPSGAVLPLILRRKWAKSETQPSLPEALAAAATAYDATISPAIEHALGQSIASTRASVLTNHIFTVMGIHNLYSRVSVALVDIQQQIHRGEETYYEDTYAHGNLFRGWDAFVDAKDVGEAPPPTSRRVPADSRWFSDSCISISQDPRASPLFRPSSHSSSITPMHLPQPLHSDNPPSAILPATPEYENPQRLADNRNVPSAVAQQAENWTQRSSDADVPDAPNATDMEIEITATPGVTNLENGNFAQSNNKRKVRPEERRIDKNEFRPTKKVACREHVGEHGSAIKLIGGEKKGQSQVSAQFRSKETETGDTDTWDTLSRAGRKAGAEDKTKTEGRPQEYGKNTKTNPDLKERANPPPSTSSIVHPSSKKEEKIKKEDPHRRVTRNKPFSSSL